MAVQVNKTYHSMVVKGVSPHTIWKNILIVSPDVMISATHVPPDRYIIGNNASTFPSFSPAKFNHKYAVNLLVLNNHISIT